MTPLDRALHRSTTLLLTVPDRPHPAGRPDHDRGDVPGWVMITVMTAIVTIALLGVFREQVINAVQHAFQSVTGAG